MLLGSFKISKLLNLIGYVRSFITLSSVIAVTVITPAINDNTTVFSICRFTQGMCIAGLYIIIESWILSYSSESNRGRNLSIYMIILYGSYSVSQFFLSEDTVNTILPFCISALLVILSIIPLSGFPVTVPIIVNHNSISLKRIFYESKVGLLGCVISGILISTIFSILPLYIAEIAENTELVARALSLTFLAGVLVQYPLGIMVDRFSKQKIQIVFNLVYAVFLTSFTILEYYSLVTYPTLLIIVIVIGAFSFTIYPISINLVCDSLKKSEIIRVIEGITIAFGIGSIIGPIYTSSFIKVFGFYGYSGSYLLLSIILVFFTTYTLTNRKKGSQNSKF